MSSIEFFQEYFLLLLPLLVLQMVLFIIAIVDLIRRERVVGDNKIVWALVILFVSTLGPIIYLAFGRKE